jgi:uncharacterized protein YeaO (DUF488 family)
VFRKRYLKELVSEEAQAALEKLYTTVKSGKKLTLVYASKDEERNNAVVLKELLDGSRKPPSSVGRAALGGSRTRKAKKQ